MLNQKNLKNKLEQIEEAEAVIEEGLLKSASAVRNFLVNQFDEVIKDKEE